MTIIDSFRLDGKAALVTGANRGLGRGIASALADAGADIIGLSRSDAGETADRVRELGRQYHHIALDLAEADPPALANVIEQAVGAFGRLDILVNNAGIVRRAPAFDFPADDWHTVIQINLNAAFFLAQAAGRYMRDHGGGKIINIASMLSYQGGILIPAYTAAKHGVMGITRALANEWAAHQINVNAIAPGYFETDVTAPLRADDARNAAILARIPAGRWGIPDELGGAAVFLASEASAYVHGTTIDVDGGWMSR